MPIQKADIPPAAQPLRKVFDPWNPSSNGHQRAENKLGESTGWRLSRNMKLSHQFRSGSSGGKRISDTVGAGSQDRDEKMRALMPKDVMARAECNVRDMLIGGKNALSVTAEEKLMARRKQEDDAMAAAKENRQKGVFDGLAIYINGSTHPIISDHKLKHMLAENGARLMTNLGRRSVTHVILGKPATRDGGGAGGGLAASKIQKEVKRVGGCGVKFVGVEWVLESLRVGKRLSEIPYTNLKMAAKGQQSVHSMFAKSKS
ncbi:hypothetical protein BJ878DRAFT_506004 [Calycina marina]|uniref:BRCT domain-containing protein n=1 Tax=Calycina marina TaxID=1763456 RepID=A0A9P7Z391_9HELO|nr:hypothetical protein BJ878DRAFT_506004 [Calycina marina]